jgi:[acyl-carrier-protein] S-malonyltransferase
MAPVAEGLTQVLASVTISVPKIGIITNVTATVNQDPTCIKDLLIQQVTTPVRWEESMKQLSMLGCGAAVEVGPGKVVTGLLRRIVSDRPWVSFGDPASLAEVKGVFA